MDCKLKRKDVSHIVCGVIAGREGQQVTELTCFGEDLGVDTDRQESYYASIEDQLEANSCRMKTVVADDFGAESIQSVGDMVDLVFGDL